MKKLPDNDIRYDQPKYITELQTYLRTLAAREPAIPLINVDGIYGPETTAAVKAFQQAERLPITGQVDLTTWNAIYQEYLRAARLQAPARAINPFPPGEAVVKTGSEGDVVYVLQTMLNVIRRHLGIGVEIPITGRYDKATSQAVRELQRYYRLESTGDTDAATWDYLAHTYNTAKQADTTVLVPPSDSGVASSNA